MLKMDAAYLLSQTVPAAVIFAVLAFCYSLMISGKREILGFLPTFYEKVFGVNNPLYTLLTCAKCFAGQISFWISPFLFCKWVSVAHILITAFSIVFAYFLAKLSNK